MMAADQPVAVIADAGAQSSTVTAAATAAAAAAFAAKSRGTAIAAITTCAAGAVAIGIATTITRKAVFGTGATGAATAAAAATTASASTHCGALIVIVAETDAEMSAGIEARPIVRLHNGRVVKVCRANRCDAPGHHDEKQRCDWQQMFHSCFPRLRPRPA
jgi:hypothetical protein